MCRSCVECFIALQQAFQCELLFLSLVNNCHGVCTFTLASSWVSSVVVPPPHQHLILRTLPLQVGTEHGGFGVHLCVLKLLLRMLIAMCVLLNHLNKSLVHFYCIEEC